MQIRWLGQSAFLLDDGSARVALDPWGELPVRWDYAPIDGLEADVLLVTHEHPDHNGVEKIAGDPHVHRSRAGTVELPIGELRAVASEHDPVAGTRRGANTILCFSLDGLRLC